MLNYIFDTQNEIRNRIKALSKQEPSEIDIDPEIVRQLKEMLDENNPLVKIFRHARDILEKYKDIDISIRTIGADKGDPIQYEMPHTEDLALLIVGDFTLEKCQRDIIVSTKQKGLQCLLGITISSIISIRRKRISTWHTLLRTRKKLQN